MSTTTEVSADRRQVFVSLTTLDGTIWYRMTILAPGEAYYKDRDGKKVHADFAMENYHTSTDGRKTWQHVRGGSFYVPVGARSLLWSQLREIRGVEHAGPS